MPRLSTEPVPAPSLGAYFLLCLRVGLLSFGGGLSGWMYREVVDARGWMSQTEFLSALGLSQILPGTNISNLTVSIGQRLLGMRGAAAGLLGLLLGPFFAVIALVGLYGRLEQFSWFSHLLEGIAAAAIGLLLLTALRAGQHAASGVRPLAVMAATFVAIGLLHWPLVPVVLVLAPISVALAWNPEREPGDEG